MKLNGQIFNGSKLKYLTDLKVIFCIYLVITVAISLHKYSIGRIHNFEIFRQSFYNLIDQGDIYVRYPKLWLDYYKYSPAFALLIAPISILPKYLGVIAWNLVNTIPLFFAVSKLDFESKKKAFILWIIFVELVTSIQNCQSNGIYTALFVFTFILLENKRSFWAALIVALLVYIKIFGGIAAILFIFYPGRFKFLLYLTFWFAVLALFPLLVVSPDQLLFLYERWYNLLTRDALTLYGLSVMGVVKTWFGLNISNLLSILGGLVLLALPLLRISKYNNSDFRRLFLSSLLIWTVIFNHKAESPMFVIAVTGVAIWYVLQKSTLISKSLLWFTLVVTSLSSTDIFPAVIRDGIIQPYLLKAIPCIVVWIAIERQLLTSSTAEGL